MAFLDWLGMELWSAIWCVEKSNLLSKGVGDRVFGRRICKREYKETWNGLI
jgi:hypothetical protein